MRGQIFDFDGVIADSEALANTVLAEVVSGLGRKTSLEDALTRYMGKRWPEVLQRIEETVLGGVAEPVARFIGQKLGAAVEPVMYPNPDTYVQSFGKVSPLLAWSSSSTL